MKLGWAALGFCVPLALGCPKPDATRSDAPKGSDAPSEPSSIPSRHAAFSERAAERSAFIRETVEERGVRDARVLRAMRTVPRHHFVPSEWRGEAYTDQPLPIGGGQTISQPYIVAYMTEAAAPRADSRCLEIGTGSGYQAAVLAELCRSVYSIEYLREVARLGESNLRSLGYGPERVQLRIGDGYRGWPEAAPFDVIVVTAAPEKVPQPLFDQLAVGGKLVIPVGSESGAQQLERWTRRRAGSDEGAFERERLLDVRFVPFLGKGDRK